MNGFRPYPSTHGSHISTSVPLHVAAAAAAPPPPPPRRCGAWMCPWAASSAEPAGAPAQTLVQCRWQRCGKHLKQTVSDSNLRARARARACACASLCAFSHALPVRAMRTRIVRMRHACRVRASAALSCVCLGRACVLLACEHCVRECMCI
jgi:hypothetical protein